MITTIPLNKLVASPRNVRRRDDAEADRELRADIAARGLLQNLVVTKAAKPRGCFAVEAGERRRRALQSLAEEGLVASNVEVCCLVIDAGSAAHEASLAENFQRLAMNPADECLAFQQLIDQGSDVDGIARRFGLTTRFVEGRLRLASLAPVIFEVLGAGEISLDVAKAYAVTSDRERQQWVFEQMGRGYGATHPDSIRRMMSQATARGSDRRARLVGEDAYLAAGGRIECDLFSDGEAAHWLDVPLLERLAGEKMERLAAEAAAETGLAFVRPVLESWIGHSHLQDLRRLAIEPPPLTDEESVRVEALEAELEELAALLEDEDVEAAAQAQAEAQVRQLSDAIDAIVDKPPVLDPALRATAGTFLVLDEEGRARLDTSFYTVIAGEGEEPGEPDPDGAEDPAPRHKAGGLSQRLVDELAMQRRDILAVHLAADPALALDAAIFLMVDAERGYRAEKSGFSLAASPPASPVFDFRTPGAAATIAREQSDAALDRSWMDGTSRAERFDAFRALPEDRRAAWLGHAVARTLEASLNLAGGRYCAFHDHLGQLLGIDVARWWRPTGANYFDRVPKSVTLAALEEIGGASLAERYSTAKKAELAQSCERIFAGDFIADPEVKEAALSWVPQVMRFAPTESADDPEANSGVVGGATEDGQVEEEGSPPAAAGGEIEEAA